jgi:formylglycine-generating enzyme required for sulfatase activity
MVLIPAGTFMMGSPGNEKDRSLNEGPQHEVTISKPFYMGNTKLRSAMAGGDGEQSLVFQRE